MAHAYAGADGWPQGWPNSGFDGMAALGLIVTAAEAGEPVSNLIPAGNAISYVLSPMLNLMMAGPFPAEA